MTVLVRFPPERSARPSLARLRCDECGASPMIFVPGDIRIWSFCGPLCAAGCGVEPWASADLVDRAGWQDRGQIEASA